MSLKTLVLGLGGAGSNIIECLHKEYGNKDYIKFMTVDSSNANVKENIDFYHIRQNTLTGNTLSGTGGIRGEHFEDFKEGVKRFIDENMLHQFDGTVILAFSTSGGTGSVLGPTFLMELLPLAKSVACILVHDSNNKYFSQAGKKTLETLYNIANSNNYCLGTMYYNNKNTITVVNETIVSEFGIMIKFHDTDNITEIDNQDMKNFYNFSKYRFSGVMPGIYGLVPIHPKFAEEAITKHKVIIGRSLTNGDIDPLNEGGIEHSKNGKSLDGSEHMLLMLNNFDKQYGNIKAAFESFTKEHASHGIDTNVRSDKNGMVF